MKKNLFKLSFVFTLAVLISSACTKLEPKPFSGLTTEEFYSDTNSIINAQDFVTTALIGFGNGEQTRIGNAAGHELADPLDRFGDATPGYIKDCYQHNFNPSLIRFNMMWNTFFAGISKANLTLSELKELKNRPNRILKVEAELKVARAFFFFHAMDNFGNVPLDTLLNADPATVKTNSRTEVFNFIEKELLNNIPLLDDKIAPNNRINKLVANTLLAQLYLNAQVFKGTAEWEKVIPACNAVIESGKYTLATNYFENFAAINSKSENILVSFREAIQNQGSTFIVESVYDTGGPAIGIVGTPWNGFVGTADLYNIYKSEDLRKRMWLIGQQRASASPSERAIDGVPNTGAILSGKSRGRSQLIYNTNIRAWGLDLRNTRTNPIDSQFMAGVRNVKYYPERGSIFGSGTNMGNDYVIMRLADVILMKAEAQFRLGDMAGAIATINPIRVRAFGNANFNFATLTIEDIRDERTRELMLENYARRDNIRFEVAGSTIKYWSQSKLNLKPLADASINTRLYPIPARELLLNPKLVQNPGY